MSEATFEILTVNNETIYRIGNERKYNDYTVDKIEEYFGCDPVNCKPLIKDDRIINCKYQGEKLRMYRGAVLFLCSTFACGADFYISESPNYKEKYKGFFLELDSLEDLQCAILEEDSSMIEVHIANGTIDRASGEIIINGIRFKNKMRIKGYVSALISKIKSVKP